MTLPEDERRTFLNAHLDLLRYAGQRGGAISGDMDYQKFLDLNHLKKKECRDVLLENEELIDDFLIHKNGAWDDEQKAVVLAMKRAITGDFILLKCLKHHAIFLEIDTYTFYAVKALRDPFTQMLDRFPTYLKTSLVPFKDKIVYDGFLLPYSVVVGAGMKKVLTAAYKTAKRNGEIVTTF